MPTEHADGAAGRRASLREQRLEELMRSCQDEVLRQIIGPFGLTKVMFDDVDGGAVTTVGNFEKGVTANAADKERYDSYHANVTGPIERSDYDKDLPGRRKKMFQADGAIISAYTGANLDRDGSTHLDHVQPVASIETNARANLVMGRKERVAMANAPENLVPAESSINQSMQDRDKQEWANSQRKKDPGKTNAESFGVDLDLLKETKARADAHIKVELLKAQVVKQGTELAKTGGEIAVRNGLKQALGVLLHAFVQGSFSELRTLLTDKQNPENLVDRITAALQRVLQRVVAKLRHAWNALVEGGAQGFLSNLLTYVINCFVTTSAKIVTLIREIAKGCWDAVKLMLSPPPGLPPVEVARQCTKLIATVVTTSVGMLFEESLKGLLLGIPLLAPLADTVAPALTAFLTGLTSALVIYGIDRLFDWLSSTGTELLTALESTADAQAQVAARLGEWAQSQYAASAAYEHARSEYERIRASLALADDSLRSAVGLARESANDGERTLEEFRAQVERRRLVNEELRLGLAKRSTTQ